MAGIREVLQFLIEADATQAIRTFDNVEKASARSLGKAETSSQKFSAALTKGGAAAVAASATLGVGLYKLANQASNLELSQRRLGGIFGENADKMIKFSTGLNKIGLSDKDAAAAIAQIGEAARGLGLSADEAAKLTPQLVTIVTQLGYLQGLSPGEALETVNAAMRGEYDSLQRLVPAINQATINQKAMETTGKKNAQQLTNTEKTMAALTLIIEKGSATLGRSGDVMNTLAGRAAVTKANLSDLGTAIGSGALPVVQELSTWVGKAAGAFNAMPDSIQQTAGRLGAFGAVSGAAIGSLALIAGEAIKLRARFTELQTSAPRTAAAIGALGKISVVIGVWEAAREAIRALGGDSRATAEDISNTADSFRDLAKASSAADIDKALKDVHVSASDVNKVFDDMHDRSPFEKITGNIIGFTDAATGMDTSLTRANNRIDKMDKALASLAATNPALAANAFAKLRDALVLQGVDPKKISALFNDYNRAVKDNANAASDAADKNKDLGAAAAGAGQNVGTAADAIKNANDAAKQHADMLGLAAQGATAFADAIERTTAADDQIAAGLNIGKASADFAETVKNLPGTIDQTALALGRYNEDQTTAISNLMALSDQTSQYLTALLQSGSTSDQVKQSANNLALAYAQQMIAAGKTQDQVQSYLKILGLTPDQVNTAISVSGTEVARQKLALLQTSIDTLPKDVQTKVTQQIIKGDYEGALATINAYYASNPAQLPVNVVLQSQSVERARRFGYSSPTTPGREIPLGRGLRVGGPVSYTAPGYTPRASVVNVYMPMGSRGSEVVAAIRKYEKANGTPSAGWHPL